MEQSSQSLPEVASVVVDSNETVHIEELDDKSNSDVMILGDAKSTDSNKVGDVEMLPSPLQLKSQQKLVIKGENGIEVFFQVDILF